MASEQLKTVLELVGSADLGTLTLQERRALMGSAGAPLPEGTQIDPVDANGVPAEWVVAAGVTGERVVLFTSPAAGLILRMSGSGGYTPCRSRPLVGGFDAEETPDRPNIIG